VLDDWLESSTDGEVDAQSKTSGRVKIGKGSRVVNSTIRGPVVIGDNVEIVDSKIGPFTSIGDGVKIERSCVEHSVIMEGSSIAEIPRLEDSLIGKRVVVHPGTTRHGALSLMVGDDCVVELSRD
jgi:glucose-1-phosphate thymidylyltransferase